MENQNVSFTLETLHEGNAWVCDRALRRFQLDIAAMGEFLVPDPVSGEKCQAEAHYYWPHNGCLYWFRGTEKPFCVVAASVRLGCPVLALVTSERVYTVADKEASPLIAMARDILSENFCPDVSVDPKARPLVFTGHRNFAHHVWNEFPGLWYLAGFVSEFDVLLLHDPLGNISAFCKAHGIAVAGADSIPSARGWQTRPTVVPGSVYCDQRVKNDLLRLLGLPVTWTPAPEPRIYLTVREKGRTLEDHDEVLALVINKVLERWPDAVFLLDGFSLPQDFARPIYDSGRCSFEERIAGARNIVSEIRKAIPKHKSSRIYDITGMFLVDALREISCCSAYVSHAGTMQHKPGWFYPLPGVQHGNTASVSAAGLAWTASMMSGAKAPATPDRDLVQDLSVTGKLTANARNRDYRFVNVQAAAEDIFIHLCNLLGLEA